MDQFRSPTQNDHIYGVLPFVAPEVLKGNPYTPASDIYSFSIIMWELISGIPPFNDRAHDFYLGLSICKGERPKNIENIPQGYIDLMKRCWDDDPLKRPDTLEIKDVIGSWID
ncbi:13020_t:CDS:2, partial [Funneliformis geosporum]